MASVANKQPRAKKKFFTVVEANRALPYVSRIMEDIRTSYSRARELEDRMDRPMPDDNTQKMQDEFDRTIEDLNRFVQELQQVGVHIKDYDLGLLDFPGEHEGREICLCWKRGEDKIHAWHEVDGGYAGRKDLKMLEKSTLGE